MTAPQPSTPEELLVALNGAVTLDESRSLIASRDAALLAPLREENARLRAEATAHMGVARAAEAEVARLRAALTDIAAPRYGLDASDESQDHAKYWSELALSYRRAAAKALAPEGGK